jgi:hypothetical protein
VSEHFAGFGVGGRASVGHELARGLVLSLAGVGRYAAADDSTSIASWIASFGVGAEVRQSFGRISWAFGSGPRWIATGGGGTFTANDAFFFDTLFGVGAWTDVSFDVACGEHFCFGGALRVDLAHAIGTHSTPTDGRTRATSLAPGIALTVSYR